jgi:hypothetical protein
MSESGKEENPVVILGGGRQAAGPNLERNETDDSVLHSDVGKYLRDYLPDRFPGKYERGREPIMEWVNQYIQLGIMNATDMRKLIDWNNGFYQARRSLCSSYSIAYC